MSRTRTLHLFKAPQAGIPIVARHRYHWPTPGFPHMHEHLQILLILSGKTDILWEGRTTPASLQADDICIIPPQLPHQVELKGQKNPVDLIDLHIDLAHDNPLARGWREQASMRIGPGQAAVMAQMASLLDHAADMPAHARDHLLVGCAWLALGLAGAAPASASQHQVDRRLLAAERFIIDHLGQPISAPDIARACGLSVSQLNRLYRQHRQTTPARQVMDARLALARELLPASPLALKQIARECGFVCVNHFSRVFKEHVGMTPGDYRQHALGASPA